MTKEQIQILLILALSAGLANCFDMISKQNEKAPVVATVPAVTESSIVEAIEEAIFNEPTTEEIQPEVIEEVKPVKKAKRKPAAKKVSGCAPTVMFKNPQQFLNKAVPIAKKVSRQTGIPASIIIAQSMVESASGSSTLAIKANNFFGHKCHQGYKCRSGHCINRTDDHHKDFFVKYASMEASFKAHGQMLTNNRYKSLKKYGDDYRSWARGLKSKGYATASNYAQILIGTIEKYELYKYD